MGAPCYQVYSTTYVVPASMESPNWTRDIQTESLTPISMYPAGWWVRNG